MRNTEALRNYFLGKDPQLKVVLSDNSLRLCGIEGKHYVLRTELIQKLKELKKYVDDNDKELQDAIDALANTLAEEIERLETKYDITEDVRLYELENAVYRIITPEIRIYFKQNSFLTNDDDLILIKEAKAFLMFSRDPDTEKPTFIYGVADETDGWYKTLMLEDIEQNTNKKDVLSQSSTEYPSMLALYNALQNYYTKEEVNQLISVIPRFDIEVVEELPTEDISETTIYLVPSADPQTANSYDEFIYVSGAWEQIGSTAIDLSNYYTKEEINTLLEGIDEFITLEAGNINIYELEPGAYHVEAPEAGEVNTFYSDSTHNFSAAEDTWIFVSENTTGGWLSWIMLNGNNGVPSIYAGYYSSVSEAGTYTRKQISNLATSAPFIGTNGVTNGASGMVPAPHTTDLGKYLNADGHWETVGGVAKTVSGSIRLYSAEPGVYFLESGTTLYWNGDTDTQNYTLFSYPGIITVFGEPGSKQCAGYWFNGGSVFLIEASTDSSLGIYSAKQIDQLSTLAFLGTDGSADGIRGLVPAPTISDAGKFLCADGTWAEVSVQIPTISTADIDFLFA